MEENKGTDSPKTDAMSEEEACRIRILIAEDKAKYALEIARHEAAIGQLRMYIAECDATMADIDRREAGVEYPKPPPAKEPAKEPEAPEAK